MKHSSSQPAAYNNNNNSSINYSMKNSVMMNSLNARDSIPEHLTMKVISDADTLVAATDSS